MVTTRTEIIQALIDKRGYKSYLEIGVQNTLNNFDKIRCDFKVGVDPDPNAKATYPLTSNEFFLLAHARDLKFDIIFIDGLHHVGQVIKDGENALECLTDLGSIIIHDCNPESELAQQVPRETKVWNGDGWKSILYFRENKDICVVTINCDHGCGFIQRGWQEPFKVSEELTYENLSKNRQRWLNLVSPEYFERVLI